MEEAARDFPGSAGLHNSLARLGARCGRQLDVSLEAAHRALELKPNAGCYLDTLAEVHFQRGDQDLAMDTAKRCLELAPKNAYYLAQFERFQAGDVSAPLTIPRKR